MTHHASSPSAPIAAGAGDDLALGSDIAIAIDNLTFGFPGVPNVLEGIDLHIGRGEIVAIIGPSGCGKSTLLNLIAGLLPSRQLPAVCFGKPVRGPNRRVSYMTQQDTLLPWRNGIDNAALPLELKGIPKKERYERARAAMARVGVAEAERRRPHQLSGGMRSRLSLARALLSEADILLMDEPFAAVDALRRVRLQQLLLDVWESTHKTIVYVTHDLNEAIALGHRVIVMSARPGRIRLERAVESAHPRNIARFPSTQLAKDLYVELWAALEELDAS